MNRFNFQKLRMIKFLLPISSLFVLFSVIPLLLQSLKPFLIDKSYMFLLCNGLVVFILKNSGLVDVKKGLEIEHNLAEETEEKEDYQERKVSDEEDEKEEEEEEEQGIDDHAITAIDDGVEEEEEAAEDTDELNQKVEEFIRKMKEAISLERRLLHNSDAQIVVHQY